MGIIFPKRSVTIIRGIENDTKTINFIIKMKLSKNDRLSTGLEYVFCLTVIINHFNLRIYSCIFRLCSLFGQPHKGQLY